MSCQDETDLNYSGLKLQLLLLPMKKKLNISFKKVLYASATP